MYDKEDRYIVNGAHDCEKLQSLLDGFIKRFVLCPNCDNPETTLVSAPVSSRHCNRSKWLFAFRMSANEMVERFIKCVPHVVTEERSTWPRTSWPRTSPRIHRRRYVRRDRFEHVRWRLIPFQEGKSEVPAETKTKEKSKKNKKSGATRDSDEGSPTEQNGKTVRKNVWDDRLLIDWFRMEHRKMAVVMTMTMTTKIGAMNSFQAWLHWTPKSKAWFNRTIWRNRWRSAATNSVVWSRYLLFAHLWCNNNDSSRLSPRKRRRNRSWTISKRWKIFLLKLSDEKSWRKRRLLLDNVSSPRMFSRISMNTNYCSSR